MVSYLEKQIFHSGFIFEEKHIGDLKWFKLGNSYSSEHENHLDRKRI